MNYIASFFAYVVVLLITICCFNWFVDPYGVYWSPTISGLNQNKIEAENRGRLIKPLRAAIVNPEILLIGNSRIEIGVPAESIRFNSKTVYNLGIPGVTIDTQLKGALTQIANNPNLQHIILTLDYRNFLFNYTVIAKRVNINSILSVEKQNHVAKTKLYLSVLMSLDALKSSIKTIAKQSFLGNNISFFGSNSAGTYKAVIQNEGLDVMVTHQLGELRKKLLRPNVTYFSPSYSGNFGLQLLDEFLAKIKTSGKRITFFVNPYHYTYMHTLEETGHWETFLNWKRELAALAELHKEAEFYDFSLFNEHTLENLQTIAPRKPAVWFWEPTHYTKEYGDIILSIVLPQKSDYPVGAELSQSTLPSLLENNTTGLEDSRKMWIKYKSEVLEI